METTAKRIEDLLKSKSELSNVKSEKQSIINYTGYDIHLEKTYPNHLESFIFNTNIEISHKRNRFITDLVVELNKLITPSHIIDSIKAGNFINGPEVVVVDSDSLYSNSQILHLCSK